MPAAKSLPDPLQAAYLVAAALPFPLAARQELLEAEPVAAKLRLLVQLLQHELAVRELGRRIQTETQERMTRQQRDFLLREQLRSIQTALGEGGEGQETADLRRRIEAAGLPEEARREAERELQRLESLSQASPEGGIIRTYLEWMATLPWRAVGGGEIDVAARPRRAGRGPLRPPGGQGPHPGVPRGAQAAPPAPRGRRSGRPRRRGPGGVPPGPLRRRPATRPAREPILLLRRPAGGGQDLPRAVHRPRPGAQVRAHVPRGRARRGGDPGPPAHLHRGPPRPHPPGHCAAPRRAIRCSCWTRSTS